MTRVAVMLSCIAAMAICLLIAALNGCTRSSNQSHYHFVHGWPILPDGFVFGDISGVGIDSHDNVFVFHRAGRTWIEPFPDEPIQNATIILFDGRTGKLLASWGEKMFIMPHGLTVDQQDNVWVTDVGLQQVFKFSHDGKLLMTIGERGVPGSDGSHFNRPTDVAILPDRSFYVSDGYGNSRVLKFSADGRMLFEWGKKGAGPGDFDLPHGIAVDTQGRVYVCDRSNSRVQVFDGSGKFFDEWDRSTVGRPFGISIGADGYVYVVDGGDEPETLSNRAPLIRLDAKGKVVDRCGTFGNHDGQFNKSHDVAVAGDGAVYVVDLEGKKIQKFIRGSVT
jgi:peptidylamidoglycolate lyase